MDIPEINSINDKFNITFNKNSEHSHRDTFSKVNAIFLPDLNAYQILKTHANGLNGGVLHCYNASPLLANLSEFGFYFGIGGVLTFKNAKNLVEILPKLPLDKIVVETDAPYLTPHPHRGERNEPAFTSLVVDKIAEILDKDVELIKNITTQNAYRLFANQIKGD